MVASDVGAALIAAGFDQMRFQLKIVAPQFTREQWIAIWDEATKGTLSEGHPVNVRKDHMKIADAQLRMVEEGQGPIAETGHPIRAPLHQPKPGEGHEPHVVADQNTGAIARPPMPEGQIPVVREDHCGHADGQPIASGEANGILPEKATLYVPPARDPISPIRDEGHGKTVSRDQITLANVPNPLPREGHVSTASNGQLAAAKAGNPIASGKANEVMPEKVRAHLPPARVPAPIRRPTPEQRTAALRVGHTSVAAIFERKLPDNVPVGDVYSDQLPRRIANNMREASFLKRLMNYGQPPEPMKIRDYIPAEYVAKVWKESSMMDVTSALGEGILLSPDGKLSLVRKSA